MRKLALAAALGLALAFGDGSGYALAGDGSGYAVPQQGCRTHLYRYDPGKTSEGFAAQATDGCHTADWTGSIGQGPGGGTVTFLTTGDNRYSWQGNGLPSPAGGDQNACLARAVQEANGYFTNLFRAPAGTEVTVRYRCD